jgi:hypothetical protein
MVGMVLEQIKSRKFFYRNLYRKELIFLIAFLLMAIMWIVLIVIVAIDHMHTVPSFYATSSDGILTPLKPMPQPNRSAKAMLE